MKTKLILFLLCIASSVMAQQLRTGSFVHDTEDIDATVHKVYDANNKPCALVKVQLVAPAVEFSGDVVKTKQDKNEHWAYMAEGATYIKIQAGNYIPYEYKFPEPLVGGQTYILKVVLPSSKIKVSAYIEAGFLAGSLMGPELSLGAYIGGFNIEAIAMLPMVKEEIVYWQSESQSPIAFSYKPSLAFGAKIGFGIMAGRSFRITPQAGVCHVSLKETAINSTSLVPAKGANCLSAIVSCKLQYMINKNYGISITPEYTLPVAKSKGFQALADASTNINKWNNGVSVKVSVNVEF